MARLDLAVFALFLEKTLQSCPVVKAYTDFRWDSDQQHNSSRNSGKLRNFYLTRSVAQVLRVHAGRAEQQVDPHDCSIRQNQVDQKDKEGYDWDSVQVSNLLPACLDFTTTDTALQNIFHVPPDCRYLS
ncbi:hypothetical protein SRHO_G00102750, partial [Serrasalmus rhombeus]